MDEDRLIALFEEFLTYYKIINREKLIHLLETELSSRKAIEIYQLTDGETSTRELAGMLKNKCSHATVANYWKKWAMVGIVLPTAEEGRYRAAFNLDEFGINWHDVVEED